MTTLNNLGVTYVDATVQASAGIIASAKFVNPVAASTLNVGEIATYTINGVNKALNITTSDGQIYELCLSLTTQPASANLLLLPNNLAIANTFAADQILSNSAASATIAYANMFGWVFTGFILGGTGKGLTKAHLFVNTATKGTISRSYGFASNLSSMNLLWGRWNDSVTAWSSLGTLDFSGATLVGTATVRRLR